MLISGGNRSSLIYYIWLTLEANFDVHSLCSHFVFSDLIFICDTNLKQLEVNNG